MSTELHFARPEPLKHIAVGETVRWKSGLASHASQKEKTGVILAFVPAWAHAKFLAPAAYLPEVASARRRFYHSASRMDRYVVEVPRTDKRGQPLPSHFYAPYAGVVETWNPSARLEGEEDDA